jgi:putative redox protein
MTGFAQLFNNTRAALATDGAQTIVKFNAASQGKNGLHRNVKIRGFAVEVDEPPALGGTDKAPNPAEYALAALATCQEITYRLHADALGIPLKDVSVELEGELDLRGFFGAAEGVRPGFLNIKGSVSFDSTASTEELKRLKAVVDAHCPVLDLFSNATPVQIAIAAPVKVAAAA